MEKARSATAYAGVGEALARKVALPLLLDLDRQLLLAHLIWPGLAGRTEELLLLVEALDQPTPPFLSGKFFGVADGQLPLSGPPLLAVGRYPTKIVSSGTSPKQRIFAVA